jgi:hypothetical protein
LGTVNAKLFSESRQCVNGIIRKILDERKFIPKFKQLWVDVKANKIDVKKPWER